jgi:hypothetical protein
VRTGSVTDTMLCKHRALWRIRHRIEGLGSYQFLLLLAVPTSIVEPLKLVRSRSRAKVIG